MNVLFNPVMQGVVDSVNERQLIDRHKYKLSFEAIYNWDKPVNEEIFDSIRIFCSMNAMRFEIRPFNTAIEEDREYVEKLPAIQVYYEEEFEMTFYLTDPFEPFLYKLLRGKEVKKKPWRWYTFKLPSFKQRVAVLSSHEA